MIFLSHSESKLLFVEINGAVITISYEGVRNWFKKRAKYFLLYIESEGKGEKELVEHLETNEEARKKFIKDVKKRI